MTTTGDFYGLTLGEAPPSGDSATNELLDVFAVLKPKPSRTPLVRIGADTDGSYLVPDDLDGISACFSPGANRIKHFEDFLADHHQIPSHMCDYTCEADDFTTPLKPLQTFVKKWLDVVPGDDNISLETWVTTQAPTGDLLLQMDIEGAEYRNLLRTPTEILARFRIVVLEVHGLDRMLERDVLRYAIHPFFEKLGRLFTTVHAHPNNCCGEFSVPGTDVRIPRVLELTLVRNDRFVAGDGPANLPHRLDVSRNVPRKPPLVLSDAWCDYNRPVEARLKVVEDLLTYRGEQIAPVGDRLSSTLSMTMHSLQTLASLVSPPGDRARRGALVDVAHGKPFRLSSSLGSAPEAGFVRSKGNYFFHTDVGVGEWIEIDLGQMHTVCRIEITNRRDGHHDRSRHLFVRLAPGKRGRRAQVFPLYKEGAMAGGAWRKCAVDVPPTAARYVTITSPTHTALHFSRLRVLAVSADGARPEDIDGSALLRDAKTWARRRLEKGVDTLSDRVSARIFSVAIRPARPPAERG